MGKCSNCNAKTNLIFGNTTQYCSVDGCEKTGCDTCRIIKECPKCGDTFCAEHYSQGKHECTDEEQEEQERKAGEPEYIGKFAVLWNEEFVDVNEELGAIERLENDGWEVCPGYSVIGELGVDGALIFRRK